MILTRMIVGVALPGSLPNLCWYCEEPQLSSVGL
jgi:hypothetical protein